MTKLKKGLVTRGPGYGDESFIYSTWLRGLYYGNDWFRKIDKKSFFDKYRIVIAHLLKSSNVELAVLEDQPDVIVGYSVHSGNTLHWVYVKRSWRALGIGKALIPEGIECVTHLTKKAAKKKPDHIRFDPLIT